MTGKPKRVLAFGGGLIAITALALGAISGSLFGTDTTEAGLNNYLLALDAPASDGVGGATFNIVASIDHSGVTSQGDCLDPEFGTALDPAPYGCYLAVQWFFSYDPAVIDIDLAATAKTGPAPTECIVKSDDLNGTAGVGCITINADSPLIFQGDAWNIVANCIGNGTTSFDLAGTAFTSEVSSAQGPQSTQIQNDQIACGTGATQTPTHTPTNTATPAPPTNTPTNTFTPTPCPTTGCTTPTVAPRDTNTPTAEASGTPGTGETPATGETPGGGQPGSSPTSPSGSGGGGGVITGPDTGSGGDDGGSSGLTWLMAGVAVAGAAVVAGGAVVRRATRTSR